jgi:23S rRNA pseudouridine1911/1915/1917 synthase
LPPRSRRPCIELSDGTTIPILHEDRSVIAIDKPAGWVLGTTAGDRQGRGHSSDLQRALEFSIRDGDFWARTRGLKFVRFVHRLDAGTSGVLLLVRSHGAIKPYSQLFEEQAVAKRYLAVVHGQPLRKKWTCTQPLEPHPQRPGAMRIAPRGGKPAETHFEALLSLADRALVAAEPRTGRTHQIRVHLAASGHPVLHDSLYGGGGESLKPRRNSTPHLALRAVSLDYRDPFTGKAVHIAAPWAEFVERHGFDPKALTPDRGSDGISS